MVDETLALCFAKPYECLVPILCRSRGVFWSRRSKWQPFGRNHRKLIARKTLEALRDRPDLSTRVVRSLKWLFRSKTYRYTPLGHDDGYETHLGSPRSGSYELETRPQLPLRKHMKSPISGKLPFRRIWTPNVCLTLLTHFLIAFQ